MRHPTQTPAEFLAACGIKENTLEAAFALQMREKLADYSVSKTNQLLAEHKIASDLNIDAHDSLNLIDIVLELEAIGITFNEEEFAKVFAANQQNDTVANIIRDLVAIVRNR